jgi:hypothetical protein
MHVHRIISEDSAMLIQASRYIHIYVCVCVCVGVCVCVWCVCVHLVFISIFSNRIRASRTSLSYSQTSENSVINKYIKNLVSTKSYFFKINALIENCVRCGVQYFDFENIHIRKKIGFFSR